MSPPPGTDGGIIAPPTGVVAPPPPAATALPSLSWQGEVPSQKWMNFYTKVLARFATDPSLRLRVHFTVAPEGGVSPEKAEETRMGLKDLGLTGDLGPAGERRG